MKRFLYNFLFILTPVFLTLVSVNYIGDAGHLYSVDYERRIAKELLNGSNVTNVSNHDERLLQRYFTNSKLCPEVLVLGSSREMLINKSYFPNKLFLNNAVSGASLEDIMAILEMYFQKKCFPKKIIIGLDPWTLNKNNNNTRWRSIEKEYKEMLTRLGIPQSIETSFFNRQKNNLRKYVKYKELISLSYFKSSFYNLFLKNNKPIITNSKLNKYLTKLSDGSINYDAKFREASIAEINKKVAEYTEGDVYGIEQFQNMDKDLQQKLELLTDYLLLNHIEVEYFLVPYHPKVYDIISKQTKYKDVISSELYFNRLAKKKRVKLIGSFDAHSLQINTSDFYDGMHLKEKGIKKMLNQ